MLRSSPLLPEPARHRRGATGELEREQRRSHDLGGKAAARCERIDCDRGVSQCGDDRALVAVKSSSIGDGGGDDAGAPCTRGSRNSSSTSCAVSTSFAPSRKSL